METPKTRKTKKSKNNDTYQFKTTEFKIYQKLLNFISDVDTSKLDHDIKSKLKYNAMNDFMYKNGNQLEDITNLKDDLINAYLIFKDNSTMIEHINTEFRRTLEIRKTKYVTREYDDNTNNNYLYRE